MRSNYRRRMRGDELKVMIIFTKLSRASLSGIATTRAPALGRNGAVRNHNPTCVSLISSAGTARQKLKGV